MAARPAPRFPRYDTDPAWMCQLKDECAATSIQAAADRLGYARTTISLVVNHKYPGPTENIEKRVTQIFGGLVNCPHLKRAITPADCQSASVGAMPMNNPERLRLWTACQTCPLNRANVKELTQ